MIAVDSSTLIAYLQGEQGEDQGILDAWLAKDHVFIAPVSLTEILCNPGLNAKQREWIKIFPLLALEAGYWERAADTRRRLLVKRLKAKTADALIAQACIDADMPLLTRDADFWHYAEHCGLKLAA